MGLEAGEHKGAALGPNATPQWAGESSPWLWSHNDGHQLGKGASGLGGKVLPGRSSALGGTLGAPSATSQQLCWFSVGAMHRDTARDSCSVIAVS